MPVPGDPARIPQVAAIACCEIERILAAPTSAHGTTDEHQVALARRQRQAIPVDQVQAPVIAHQQVASMQVGVAQVQVHRGILQCSVQFPCLCMQRCDARVLLVPYRNECAAQPVLRGRQALAGQPLPNGLQRRRFKPHDRQRLLQFRWQPRAVQAPQHLTQPLPLRAAQRRLEPGLAFHVRKQGELQSPALYRRTTGQCRPRRDDLIDAERAAQPVQAVPHRRIDLVGAAFQPPLPVPRVDAIHAGIGVGTHRARHHGGGSDAIGLLQDFAEMLRRSE